MIRLARLTTSNDLIGALAGRNRFVLKTNTRRGPVYSIGDTLQTVPRQVVERLIGKGVLVADDALPGAPPRSGQSFRLIPAWGGVDERP